MTSPALLEGIGLRRSFRVRGRQGAGGLLRPRVVHAVDGVDLSIAAGETVGLVGESGCGKSTLGRLLVRLLRPSDGSVRLGGVDLAAMSASDLRAARRRLQMVFQDNGSALDPRRTVAASVGEGLLAQGLARGGEVTERVAEALERVGLAPSLGERYPHELSGGQRQRVGIARALVVAPDVVIADEPVSALDVSVRAQVIDLLADLRASTSLAMLFISHDLEVVAHLTERVSVMYLGRIVEEGPTADLVRSPRHPYTAQLLSAIPRRVPSPSGPEAPGAGDLEVEPPNPIDRPPGCAFHPRCARALPGICDRTSPPLVADGRRRLACHAPLPS